MIHTGYTGEHESCSACQAGTYKASSGSAACANCPAGKYSAAAAAVDCDECSTDSISAAGSAECECDAGMCACVCQHAILLHTFIHTCTIPLLMLAAFRINMYTHTYI